MIGKQVTAPVGAPKAGGKELEAYRDYVVRIVEKEAVNGELKEVVREYVTVAGRLRMFWDDNKELDQEGSIETKKILENDREVEFVAIVQGFKGSATATAREMKTPEESPKVTVEKCETSAVGRALGMLGYGLTGGVIAPAEDVLRAKAKETPHTDAQHRFIVDMMNYSTEATHMAMKYLEEINKKALEDLTKHEASVLIDLLKGKAQASA
jgi:hypothetical protein